MTLNEVPGFMGFENFYRKVAREAKDGDRIVEVGAFLGQSILFLDRELFLLGKRCELSCVDRWKVPKDGESGSEILSKLRNSGISTDDEFYDRFQENIWGTDILPYRGRSIDIASQFVDESLDLVFIDAAHDHTSVLTDISAWLPKVKPGGTLSGDDIHLGGVQSALAEAKLSYEIIPGRSGGAGKVWAHRKAAGEGI